MFPQRLKDGQVDPSPPLFRPCSVETSYRVYTWPPLHFAWKEDLCVLRWTINSGYCQNPMLQNGITSNNMRCIFTFVGCLHGPCVSPSARESLICLPGLFIHYTVFCYGVMKKELVNLPSQTRLIRWSTDTWKLSCKLDCKTVTVGGYIDRLVNCAGLLKANGFEHPRSCCFTQRGCIHCWRILEHTSHVRLFPLLKEGFTSFDTGGFGLRNQ